MTEFRHLELLLSALPTDIELEARRALASADEDERAAIVERLRRSFFDQMDESTRHAMLEYGAFAQEVQARAPQVGARAPDFSLKRLGSDERVRLSDHRGRPVGLIFGSYS